MNFWDVYNANIKGEGAKGPTGSSQQPKCGSGNYNDRVHNNTHAYNDSRTNNGQAYNSQAYSDSCGNGGSYCNEQGNSGQAYCDGNHAARQGKSSQNFGNGQPFGGDFAEKLSGLSGKSEGELYGELNGIVKRMKSEGTFDPAALENVYNTAYPFLNDAQRRRMRNIIDMLRG